MPFPMKDPRPDYPDPPDDWLIHDWATPLIGDAAGDLSLWEASEVRRAASSLDRSLRDVIARCAAILTALQSGPEQALIAKASDLAFHNTAGDWAKAAHAAATLQRTLDGAVHRRALAQPSQTEEPDKKRLEA